MTALHWGLGIAVLLAAALALLDWLAPPPAERAAASGVPPGAAAGDPATGRVLFGIHCSQCHGAELRGTEKGPPLMHPFYRPDHHSDLAIYRAVKQGVVQHHWRFGDMPPVTAVSPEQTRDLIAFVRSAQRRAGLVP